VEVDVGILAELDRALLGNDPEGSTTRAVIAEVVQPHLARARDEHGGGPLAADAGRLIRDQAARDGRRTGLELETGAAQHVDLAVHTGGGNAAPVAGGGGAHPPP